MVNNPIKVFDDNTRHFLEDVGNDMSVEDVDLNVVEKAKDLNIDLTSLEGLERRGKISTIEQIKKVENKEEIYTDFIEIADVSLKDISGKIFETSEKLFIVVRDDKIEYVNPEVVKLLNYVSDKDFIKERFLKFVIKDDWNAVAENIGEMLTNNKKVPIRLMIKEGTDIKINFEAIYVPDNEHFSFILVGNKPSNKTTAISGLYDKITGLPNFYLFEDRVHMAVNLENYKDKKLPKNIIAVISISIDNAKSLKTIGMYEHVLKKLAEKLILSVKKTYTIASGLKYQFWVMISDVNDETQL